MTASETLPQETLAQAARRVAEMKLGGAEPMTQQRVQEIVRNDPSMALFAKPPKKQRSDAGTKRVKPAQDAPGTLPEISTAHLDKLRLAIAEKRKIAAVAEVDALEAEREWYEYLDRLAEL